MKGLFKITVEAENCAEAKQAAEGVLRRKGVEALAIEAEVLKCAGKKKRKAKTTCRGA